MATEYPYTAQVHLATNQGHGLVCYTYTGNDGHCTLDDTVVINSNLYHHKKVDLNNLVRGVADMLSPICNVENNAMWFRTAMHELLENLENCRDILFTIHAKSPSRTIVSAAEVSIASSGELQMMLVRPREISYSHSNQLNIPEADVKAAQKDWDEEHAKSVAA